MDTKINSILCSWSRA